LGFSVENLLEEMTEKKMIETSGIRNLRELPLLIIPNNNCEWFSFIYKTSNQLPSAVASFLAAQELAISKRVKYKSVEEAKKAVGERFELQESSNQSRSEH
jgi:hypothetical protein